MIRDDAPKGVAAAANLALHDWAAEIGVEKLYSHIVGSNRRSRLMASALGFRDVNQVSLYKDDVPDGWVYRPMYIMGKDKTEETYNLSVKILTPSKANGGSSSWQARKRRRPPAG